MNKFKVTPWEVKGDIDYGKVIKEFGLSQVEKLPDIFNKNLLFRRKIIFAQRDNAVLSSTSFSGGFIDIISFSNLGII